MGQNNGGNGGRFAMAAARIAKGAASGGLGGAAAGAVTSFLPEIIKAGAILVALALLIPLMVFIGVPHIVFGYDNAIYDDIISLTERATYIDTVYKRIENYSLEYIDSIVEQVKAEYSEGDGYDDVSVESEVSNTNIYWFIAINAVSYKQDLFAMNEATIKELVMQKFSFSAVVEEIEKIVLDENDEETTVMIRTLKVNIKDLNPEELMDKLGFTDEEKNWARLLHQTLDEQNPLGGGYNGGYRIPGEAMSDARFAAMITEAEKYIGYPYVWGGSSPSTSFDCSGFVCWVINQSGVGSVGRTTAQGLFNMSTPVTRAEAKPGDLVFFHSTYVTSDTVTHIGIYVGESMMIHAGNPIGYVDFDLKYGSHFYAIGRI